MIVCNTRSLCSHLTGVQRYTSELLSRYGHLIQTVMPRKALHGAQGHIWEQLVLPATLRDCLLWSPSNTGPLSVKRQIVTIHDIAPMDQPEWTTRQFAAWYRFLTPRLLKRVQGIIAVSRFTRDRILHHCPGVERKIHVVYQGVDKRFCAIKAEATKQVRSSLGIPSPYYLVALGSLEPRKNLQRLLQAWALIQSRIPNDVWLVLAGAQGKKMVFGDVSFERLPARVYLTGYVSDQYLPALYSGALASVYLSLYEGFGLPPLESMACGTPVLTSNIASLPEVVGNAALTVNPYDVEAIGESLIRLVEDSVLRADLGRKGITRSQQFSWDKTATETLHILQQAAQS